MTDSTHCFVIERETINEERLMFESREDERKSGMSVFSPNWQKPNEYV
jgi:hypothetical protein